MESSFPDKQGAIWTISNIFQTMQFTGNILENNEQHFLRVTPWESASKLHGRLYYTSQNDKGTWEANN